MWQVHATAYQAMDATIHWDTRSKPYTIDNFVKPLAAAFGVEDCGMLSTAEVDKVHSPVFEPTTSRLPAGLPAATLSRMLTARLSVRTLIWQRARQGASGALPAEPSRPLVLRGPAGLSDTPDR